MEENPYEAPNAAVGEPLSRPGFARNWRAFLTFAALVLLSIPAAGVALFATCYAIFQAIPSRPGGVGDEIFTFYYGGLAYGGIAGSLVLGLLVAVSTYWLRQNVRHRVRTACWLAGIAGIIAVCLLFGLYPKAFRLFPTFVLEAL